MNSESEQTNSDEGKLNRTAVGRVTSNKMEQTATVVVERRVKHPVYGKYVRRSKKFHVHDPENSLNIGDVCLLYTSPSPRDATLSRMPSSA